VLNSSYGLFRGTLDFEGLGLGVRESRIPRLGSLPRVSFYLIYTCQFVTLRHSHSYIYRVRTSSFLIACLVYRNPFSLTELSVADISESLTIIN